MNLFTTTALHVIFSPGQVSLAAEDGCDLIFGLGFGFEGEIASAAATFTDVMFGFIDGFLPGILVRRYATGDGPDAWQAAGRLPTDLAHWDLRMIYSDGY